MTCNGPYVHRVEDDGTRLHLCIGCNRVLVRGEEHSSGHTNLTWEAGARARWVMAAPLRRPAVVSGTPEQVALLTAADDIRHLGLGDNGLGDVVADWLCRRAEAMA